MGDITLGPPSYRREESRVLKKKKKKIRLIKDHELLVLWKQMTFTAVLQL